MKKSCAMLLIVMTLVVSGCNEQKEKYSCDDLESLKKLASENNIDAQKKLVVCYQEAADKGDRDAQNSLGIMYYNGEGVTKDLSKALELYQRAADQGNSDAQNNLGYMFENGIVVDIDLLKALELYQRAADQGNSDAQNNLGVMYYKGKGVNKDLFKAAELYKKAVDQGHANSKNNLAILYKNGEGVNEDLSKAVKLFHEAAGQGSLYAQYNLGMMYFTGKGVTKNLIKAVELFQEAADQGDEFAIKILKDKSLQMAIPFGLKIGHVTLEQIKAIYKVRQQDVNKWTNQPMYLIDPINQIDFAGIQQLRLIFDDKSVLQALVATFDKDKFDDLLVNLETKYEVSFRQIPHVGNKNVIFVVMNGVINLKAMHLSNHAILSFNTNEFETLFQQKIETEQKLKKQKEQSML